MLSLNHILSYYKNRGRRLALCISFKVLLFFKPFPVFFRFYLLKIHYIIGVYKLKSDITTINGSYVRMQLRIVFNERKFICKNYCYSYTVFFTVICRFCSLAVIGITCQNQIIYK